MLLKTLLAVFVAALGSFVQAAEPTARVIAFHGYTNAIELKQGNTRAVLCPQAGGRVLEFSAEGKDAMYLDEQEKTWQPGKPGPSSAGRFDYGPELTVIPHPKIWSGEWTGEVTGTSSAKLTSPRDEAAGMKLYGNSVLSNRTSRCGCRASRR